jgi:hypothetical protein
MRDVGDAFRFLPAWLHPRGKPAGSTEGQAKAQQPSGRAAAG